MTRTFQAIIWDFGGVFTSSPFEAFNRYEAASGLPVTPFYFGGFLPHKKGQRARELEVARARDCTSVYFESPYRLVDTLALIAEAEPERRVVVARELTKKFEEFRRGPARNVLSHYQAKPPKGEITLVIAPSELPKWAAVGPAEA
jgi:16S rRNA (cytidine1402-2'-O)-methyltransferase